LKWHEKWNIRKEKKTTDANICICCLSRTNKMERIYIYDTILGSFPFHAVCPGALKYNKTAESCSSHIRSR
jgi:hypothetical protein